jgi:hypothetical protein
MSTDGRGNAVASAGGWWPKAEETEKICKVIDRIDRDNHAETKDLANEQISVRSVTRSVLYSTVDIPGSTDREEYPQSRAFSAARSIRSIKFRLFPVPSHRTLIRQSQDTDQNLHALVAVP